MKIRKLQDVFNKTGFKHTLKFRKNDVAIYEREDLETKAIH